MRWAHPQLLWLLLLVPLVAAFVWLRRRRGEKALAAFAETGLVPRITPDLDRRRRTMRESLRLAALALLIVALAGPQWGVHWEKVHREGVDIIVAIDTSRSMLAEDIKPNRLERAKLAVMDLVKQLQGDRIGLVAFAGTAFLECPLTLDYAAFSESLNATDVGIIPRGGTSLADAITAGINGFEAHQGKHEALILITDGEDHSGKVDAAAKKAADLGIKIYTVGVGTAEGDLIQIPGKGFVKDRKGDVVKSRLNEDALKKIALTTGGAYVHGSGASLGLEQIFHDHIDKMERRELKTSLQQRFDHRFQIPLAAAFLLLLVEPLLGDRKRAVASPMRWLRRGDTGGAKGAA